MEYGKVVLIPVDSVMIARLWSYRPSKTTLYSVHCLLSGAKDSKSICITSAHWILKVIKLPLPLRIITLSLSQFEPLPLPVLFAIAALLPYILQKKDLKQWPGKPDVVLWEGGLQQDKC